MTWNRVGMWVVLALAFVAVVASVVAGAVIVRDIDNAGRPAGYGTFGTSQVNLDMDRLPNADCWYEVDMTDNDGKPGGTKTTHVQALCP